MGELELYSTGFLYLKEFGLDLLYVESVMRQLLLWLGTMQINLIGFGQDLLV